MSSIHGHNPQRSRGEGDSFAEGESLNAGHQAETLRLYELLEREGFYPKLAGRIEREFPRGADTLMQVLARAKAEASGISTAIAALQAMQETGCLTVEALREFFSAENWDSSLGPTSSAAQELEDLLSRNRTLVIPCILEPLARFSAMCPVMQSAILESIRDFGEDASITADSLKLIIAGNGCAYNQWLAVHALLSVQPGEESLKIVLQELNKKGDPQSVQAGYDLIVKCAEGSAPVRNWVVEALDISNGERQLVRLLISMGRTSQKQLQSDPEISEHLIALLEHESSRVRFAAVAVLLSEEPYQEVYRYAAVLLETLCDETLASPPFDAGSFFDRDNQLRLLSLIADRCDSKDILEAAWHVLEDTSAEAYHARMYALRILSRSPYYAENSLEKLSRRLSLSMPIPELKLSLEVLEVAGSACSHYLGTLNRIAEDLRKRCEDIHPRDGSAEYRGVLAQVERLIAAYGD